MTKNEKALILNKLRDIPMRVLKNTSEEEIDRFIENQNLSQYMTDELLAGCQADEFMMSLLK